MSLDKHIQDSNCHHSQGKNELHLLTNYLLPLHNQPVPLSLIPGSTEWISDPEMLPFWEINGMIQMECSIVWSLDPLFIAVYMRFICALSIMVHLFSLLSHNPLYGYTTMRSSICRLEDMWVASIFWWLWIKLLITFMYSVFCVTIKRALVYISFLLGKYLGVWWLVLVGRICLTQLEIVQLISKVAGCTSFALLSAKDESYGCSVHLSGLDIFRSLLFLF